MSDVYVRIWKLRTESFAKVFHFEALETGQSAVLAHDLDQIADLVHVLSDASEALQQENVQVGVQRTLLSTDQRHVVLSELERSLLEDGSSESWADCQNEAEVNMNDVTFGVDQNVAVMSSSQSEVILPVLQLYDVHDDAVRCQALHEVLLRFFEVLSVDQLVDLFQAVAWIFLLQAVQRYGVRYELCG